jgi:hydrolase, alpha/beta domain protein
MTALVVVLALVGVVGLYRTFAGPAGVGHFRSAQDRQEYLGYYQQVMETMPAPSQVEDVITSYGTVRVYTWESGAGRDSPPVVLLPGRASGAPMWAVNIPLLIQSRRVIAFDALGDAGMSVQSAPLTSADDQAAWVDEVLADVAPDGVHLVGHSFGGATAALYARIHPERVRSLTLLEAVFVFAYPPADIMGWTVVSSIPALPEGWRNKALERIGGEKLSGTDPMELMIKAGAEKFDASLPTPSPLTDEQAEALTMPVYVAIAGRNSVAGGSKAVERAQKILPQASIQVWDNATHSLPMQEAESLTPVLEQFWAQGDTGSSSTMTRLYGIFTAPSAVEVG